MKIHGNIKDNPITNISLDNKIKINKTDGKGNNSQNILYTPRHQDKLANNIINYTPRKEEPNLPLINNLMNGKQKEFNFSSIFYEQKNQKQFQLYLKMGDQKDHLNIHKIILHKRILKKK